MIKCVSDSLVIDKQLCMVIESICYAGTFQVGAHNSISTNRTMAILDHLDLNYGRTYGQRDFPREMLI